jgi:hypothetical protein
MTAILTSQGAALERLRLRDTESPLGEGGWVLLGDRSREEIALDLVGKFWRRAIAFAEVAAEGFPSFSVARRRPTKTRAGGSGGFDVWCRVRYTRAREQRHRSRA